MQFYKKNNNNFDLFFANVDSLDSLRWIRYFEDQPKFEQL